MSAARPSWEQLALLTGRDARRDAWRVRTSTRARRLAVRVLPGGRLEIVVPRGTRPRTVEVFVSRHQRWIERTLDLYRPLDAPAGDGLPCGIHFAAIGAHFAVRYEQAPAAPRLYAGDGLIRIRGDRSRPALLRHALQRFVMRTAHDALGASLQALSVTTGLAYARVQIRRQRTRWGSCSRSGTISLNACLLFQPPPVVRYLLLHELAHTRHMNHSRRFRALMARLEPRWRELDRVLTGGWRDVPAWVFD